MNTNTRAHAPLITFALLAYNQEKYINDAVQGAFAQTYYPLEIIISDDCSSDKTFEIIEKLAKEYSGTAKLILNKNEKNLGIGGHIKKISELASGEIIVLSAGDDISLPNRTVEIASFFQDDESKYAVFSDIKIINDDGELLMDNKKLWKKNSVINEFDLLRRGGGVGAGAAYAYRTDCFFWPDAYPSFLLNEDRILPWRAHFLGGVGYIDKTLVCYRHSISGISRALTDSELLAALKCEHIAQLKVTAESAFREGYISEKKLKQCLIWISNLKKYKLSQMNMIDGLGIIGVFLSKLKTSIFYVKGLIMPYATTSVRRK